MREYFFSWLASLIFQMWFYFFIFCYWKCYFLCYTLILQTVCTGIGSEHLILRGPASCRRCSKQAAKHKSIVYFVFVYIFQTNKWLQLCCRLWWITTMMKRNLTAWMMMTIGVSGEETPKKVTLWTDWAQNSGSVYLLEKRRKRVIIAWFQFKFVFKV